MPKVTGVFEFFPGLDEISAADVAKWLTGPPLQAQTIENHIANRILYPQSAPLKIEDLKLDLAILREALKTSANFYKVREKKLTIPASFVERFGQLPPLVLAFIDAYKPLDLTQVVISDTKGEKIVGTIVTPKFNSLNSVIDLSIEEKVYKIKQGNLVVLPCSKERCHLLFKSEGGATLQSKKDNVLEAFGGALGILVDAR
jgi:hypothetical protein